MKNIYELVPKGTKGDKSNKVSIILPSNTLLVKRVYSTTRARLNSMKLDTFNYKSAVDSDFYGIEVVKVGPIKLGQNGYSIIEELKIKEKDILMFRQHFEFNMIKTLFRDDVGIVTGVAAKKEWTVEDSTKKYKFCVYGIVDAVSILSKVKVEDSNDPEQRMFLVHQ